MKILKGTVTSGYGIATPNLNPVIELIKARTGFAHLEPGTLNLKLREDYIVEPEQLIAAEEYVGEALKLKRCLIGGRKAIIVRPEKHETEPNYGHGKAYIEIMSAVHLRSGLKLKDDEEIDVEVDGDDEWWNSGLN
jgi:CTP-dependent riboflavin kinase